MIGWTAVAGISAFVVVVWHAFSGIDTQPIQDFLHASTAEDKIDQPEKKPATSGVTLDELLSGTTVISSTGTLSGEIGTTPVVKEDVLSGTQKNTNVQPAQPLTYRVLIPYLDEQ